MPHVAIKHVFGRAHPSQVREFADDFCDGKYVSPIARRMHLRDAAETQRLERKAASEDPLGNRQPLAGSSDLWRAAVTSGGQQ